MLRLAALTRFAAVDDPLVVYRRTSGSMSGNPRVLERDTLALLAKAFSVRNAPGPGGRALVYGYRYRVLSGSYLHAGRYRDALRCLVRSLRTIRGRPSLLALPARKLAPADGGAPRCLSHRCSTSLSDRSASGPSVLYLPGRPRAAGTVFVVLRSRMAAAARPSAGDVREARRPRRGPPPRHRGAHASLVLTALQSPRQGSRPLSSTSPTGGGRASR
jgi:hypothetical protein